MKRRVRLTESDLRRIVNESVRRVLREMDGDSETRASIEAARNAAIAAAMPCICPYPDNYDPDRYKNTTTSRHLSPEEEDEYIKRSQRRVINAARKAAINAAKGYDI